MEWIRHCQKNHEECKPPSLKVSNLKVIDCDTRTIVPLPQGTPYATLSYVWGTSDETGCDLGNELTFCIPQGFEDAILSATKIGLRYLWIDRYCIDQTSADKHRQIQQMDQIFSSAAITLIHAHGRNPHNSLPGVGSNFRRNAHHMSIMGRNLVLVPDPPSDIAHTIWSSRAWTFQETYLSKRTLVFTQSQLYFQCMAEHRCETIWPALENTDSLVPTSRHAIPSNTWYNSCALCMQAFEPTRTDDFLPPFLTFKVFLSQYLGRDLSFPSDLLNAFMGFLHHLWKQDPPMYHLWGICFQAALAKTTREGIPKSFDFVEQLLWSPVKRSGSGPLIKIHGIPSWTWSAWNGLSDCHWPSRSWRENRWADTFDLHVRVEDQSGQILTISQYIELMSRSFNMYNFHPHLLISGWIAMVNLYSAPFRPRYYVNGCDRAEAFDVSGTVQLFDVEVMDVQLPDDPEWDFACLYSDTWPVLLFVPKGEEPQDLVNVSGLTLKPVVAGSQVYQRVGVLEEAEFQPMTLDAERGGRLRKAHWESGLAVDCEWRSIKLV